jgi:hypothetical protein
MHRALRIASGIALLVAVVPAQDEHRASRALLAHELSVASCSGQPSSLSECTPVLSVPLAPLTKGAGGSAVATAAPVPGGSARPAILVYSVAGLVESPLRTASGTMCLREPRGACSFPALPGGTEGACDGAYEWNLQAIVDSSPAIESGAALYVQAWYRNPRKSTFASFSQVSPQISVRSFQGSPSIGGVTPSSGGEGTALTITGSGFGSDPLDLAVLLADGVGFADVTATTTPTNQAELQTQSGNPLSATVFSVGATGSGPVTVIHGVGVNLSGQSVTASSITSNSTLVRQLSNGAGTNFGSFSLGPGSASTVSIKTGSPIAGGLTLDLQTLTGDILEYRICFKSQTGAFTVLQGRIDFTGTPDASQRALHLAAHLTQSYRDKLQANASGTSVRVSMAGAAYGGIVVAGK